MKASAVSTKVDKTVLYDIAFGIIFRAISRPSFSTEANCFHVDDT